MSDINRIIAEFCTGRRWRLLLRDKKQAKCVRFITDPLPDTFSGWEIVRDATEEEIAAHGGYFPPQILDYERCLNACAEAERKLTTEQRTIHMNLLAPLGHCISAAIYATAPQRAAALAAVITSSSPQPHVSSSV
jgi:hypothetical protein